MPSTSTVSEMRRALGPVGAFLPSSVAGAASLADQRGAVRRIERAGYGSAWVNEGVGKDALVQLALLLDVTERLVLGTGIANLWVRPAQTAHGAATQLAEAYPGRVLLGLGVGYPEQAASVGRDFGKPVATMRSYLEAMTDSPAAPLHSPRALYPTIVGANGPKLIGLAAELADGAMPAMAAPDFTASARQALGPDKLLVVLIDATEEQGDVAAIAATVREQLAAGADHVVAGMRLGGDFAAGVDRLEALAPALL